MAEVVAISLEVDSGNSVNEVKKLEDAIKDINNSSSTNTIEQKFKTLNTTLESNTASFGEMSQAIEAYKTIALNAGRTSPVGKEALKNASILKDRITDLDREVDNLAQDGRRMQGAMQISQGVMGGYSAFIGISALAGEGNEALEKTLVKLTATMSIMQGIEQIRLATEKESSSMKLLLGARTKVLTALNFLYTGSIKVVNGALKSLRGALIATGIGALVVLLGVIIANFDKWKDSIMKIINVAFAPFIKVLQYLGVVDSDLEKERKKNSDAYIKRLGKEREELDKNLNQEEGRLKREISLGKARGENTDKLEKELLKIRLRGSKDRLQNLKDSRREVSKQKKEGWLEEFNELTNQIDEEKEARANAKNEIEVFNANATKEQRDAWKKASENKKADKEKADEKTLAQQKEFDAEKLALQRELEDLIISSEKNEDVRSLAQLEIKQDRDLQALRDKYGKNTELEKQLLINQEAEMDALIDGIELAGKEKADAKRIEDAETLKALNDEIALAEINTEEEKRQAEYEALDLHYQTLIDKAKKNNIDTTELEKSWNEKKAKKDKKFAEEDIKTAEDVANAKDLLINKRLGEASALSNNMSQLFSKNEKMQKANALVQIGIDTATAVSALVSSSSQNPLNATTFGLAGAVHLTTGLVSIFGNIAKAKQLLMGGSGGGATGVTPPSISIPSTDTSTINSQSTNGDGSGGFNIPTNRVVLVESDLRMMQERRNNSEIISTI